MPGSKQKFPLTPVQMLKIYGMLDLSDQYVATVWCAMMMSLRTLLRKSNLLPDTLWVICYDKEILYSRILVLSSTLDLQQHFSIRSSHFKSPLVVWGIHLSVWCHC